MILSLWKKMNMLVFGVQLSFPDNELVILKLIGGNLAPTSFLVQLNNCFVPENKKYKAFVGRFFSLF